MESILKLREKMDKCNEEITELLEERLKIALDIAKLKEKNKLKIYDSVREKEIFYNNEKKISDKEKVEFINNIFKSILEESKKYQKANL